MIEQTISLGAVLHSPGIDVTPYRPLLERHGLMLHALHEGSSGRSGPALFLLSASWWEEQPEETRERLRAEMRHPSAATIVTGAPGGDLPADLEALDRVLWLDAPASPAALRTAIRSALESIRLGIELRERERALAESARRMSDMHRVGMALSSERDLSALQELILRTSRELTSADAGTLYLIEENTDGEKSLIFAYAQNDSIEAPYARQVMPLSRASAAGFVGITGQAIRIDDVYQLPPDVEFSFNPWFDQTFGYRTRSQLVVPMQNREGRVVGVIQLINRKRTFAARLADLETVDREVIPFTAEDEQLLMSLAGQAAIALENKMLLDSIQTLFEGFVQASVTAIEARDPTTFGHSERVANLTVGIAEAINEVQRGRWAGLHFSEDQLREMRYAGLLHDFGKVGVREHVLVKPKKLYDWNLREVQSRFRLARQVIENRYLRRKLDLALHAGALGYAAALERIDSELRQELETLDTALAAVVAANEPTVLEEERFAWLMQVTEQRFAMPDGDTLQLVTDEELRSLSIRKGTLDEDERREIESHVTHSFNFLIRIPWTKDLQGIPAIAHAHHEKLNGSGYPRKLTADEIPIQARMMTIADIFDALTAADRPYKPAVPVTRALDILGFEAKDGGLDRDLLDLFIEREVYRVVIPGE